MALTSSVQKNMAVLPPLEVFSDCDEEECCFAENRPEDGMPPTMSLKSAFSQNKWSVCILASFVVAASMVLGASSRGVDASWDRVFRLRPDDLQILGSEEVDCGVPSNISALVPKPLIGISYMQKDFVNDAGVVPTYWNCSRVPGDCAKRTWGPCYSSGDIRWKEEVQRLKGGRDIPIYPPPQGYYKHDTNLAGFCRPGFLILGAGKCGTSSLYHYLTGHPRVLPAKEKQIHYFKYHAKRSVKWYLSHFPTAKIFLASGTLMTGEASPGYLPYPDVAPLVAERMPGTRLIVLGREPFARMYSSYKYSYVYPTIEAFRNGRVSYIPIDLPDSQYQKYLFSFEDTIRAELNVLKKCLGPNGTAFVGAEENYGKKRKWQTVFARRKQEGLPPLADVDSFCYGGRVNQTVLRQQWAELNAQYPEKVILDRNTHLLQSHLGRSIYVLPMEWWYSQFKADDIFFMCTEEMKDLSGASMEPLRKWLGLPKFNFSKTISQGAYNVGGYRGYDVEVKWESIAKSPNAVSGDVSSEEIPISPQLRQEVQEFLAPFNQRLVELTKRRCKW